MQIGRREVFIHMTRAVWFDGNRQNPVRHI